MSLDPSYFDNWDEDYWKKGEEELTDSERTARAEKLSWGRFHEHLARKEALTRAAAENIPPQPLQPPPPKLRLWNSDGFLFSAAASVFCLAVGLCLWFRIGESRFRLNADPTRDQGYDALAPDTTSIVFLIAAAVLGMIAISFALILKAKNKR